MELWQYFLLGGGAIAVCSMFFMLGRYSQRVDAVEEDIKEIKDTICELRDELRASERWEHRWNAPGKA